MMKNIRLFYEKIGRAKYISHLDINRAMQRALKRSKIPVWYTEGFNTHMYITFALPISLGFESRCESMDFRIVEEISYDEILDKLNCVLPEGIRATHCAEPVMKPEKIAWADYDIILYFKGGCSVADQVKSFLAQDTIVTMKKSKKGMTEVDIRPMLEVISLTEDNKILNLSLRLAAGINLNLNPNVLISALCTAKSLEIENISIIKKAILTEELTPFC